jgi:hypothetical protein
MSAEFLVAQQEHSPPAGAHLVLLAGVVIAALVVLGARWWRTRHGAGSTDHDPASLDRSTENTSSHEEN